MAPVRKRFLLALACMAILVASGCTPTVNSERACWRGNLTLTARKDADKVNRFTAGIDGPMQDLMTSSGAPTCAVAVVGGNRLATINSYGAPFDIEGPLLDPDSPRLAQTRLYMGSISKTVTALAMLRLAEQQGGGVTGTPPVSMLDRQLVDLYPPVGEVPAWSTFTPRQYLAHATGAARDPAPLNDAALQSLPASAGPHPGIHPRHAFVVYRDTEPPVTGFEENYDAAYSNIGYALVGAAVDWQTTDDVAGDSPGYERYAFQNVALAGNTTREPSMLSMCLATPWRADEMDNLARGYARLAPTTRGAEPQTVPLDWPNGSGWEGPAGGWTSTIGDLGRLIIAINTNARISEASRTQMLAQVAKGPVSDPNFWGLGVWRAPVGGDMRYGKGGDVGGYTSDFIAYRDAGVGAAIVCNLRLVSHGDMRDAIRAIIDPCFENAPGNRPAYCSPPG